MKALSFSAAFVVSVLLATSALCKEEEDKDANAWDACDLATMDCIAPAVHDLTDYVRAAGGRINARNQLVLPGFDLDIKVDEGRTELLQTWRIVGQIGAARRVGHGQHCIND